MSQEQAVVGGSGESRPDNLDRLERFSYLTGIESTDPEQRMVALQTVRPEQVLDLVSVMNGLLVDDEQPFQRNDGFSHGTVVAMGGSIIDLEPPENAHELFMDEVARIQAELKGPEDAEAAATQLYLAVIGAHMFKDGNGRTARALYELTKFGELPDDPSLILKRQKGSVGLGSRVSVGAMAQILAEDGFEQGRDYKTYDEFWVDDTVREEDRFMQPGLTGQLKHIAVRRALKDEGVWESEGANKMGILQWKTEKPERWASYQAHYENVREEWYKKFVALGKSHTGFVAGRIEGDRLAVVA